MLRPAGGTMRAWVAAWVAVMAVGCGGDVGPWPERPACPGVAYDRAAMEADISWLASPELDGRYPGTEGDLAARDLVAERFACLGLASFPGAADYHQPFVDAEGDATGNVLAYLPGEGAHADDLVVVSAHIDHFGAGRLGANDNASGVAGLMAIAAALSEGPAPDRTVVFAAFGAEESGYEGSLHAMIEPVDGFVPEDVVYNVNMDMIGSYDSTDLVYALGTFRGTPGRAAVDAALTDYPGLDVGTGDWSDLSDNETFCTRGIGYVFMWTEDLECYHRRCDTVDWIDFPHLVQVAQLTGDVARALADSPQDLRGAVRPGRDVCQ